MASPLIDACQATMTEMQSRADRTRTIGIWLGGAVTIIGLIWIGLAVVKRPEPKPVTEAPTT
jgi:hypothetical protein